MINHLWQSTWFALAAGALTLAFRGNRASVRYCLWFAASAKFLIPFTFLIDLGQVGQPVLPAVVRTLRPPLDTVMLIEPFPTTPPIARSPAKPIDWIPAATLVVWSLGFAAVALLRWRAWRQIRRAVQASSPSDIPAPVQVRFAPGLLEPGVVGSFRPMLLLPADILNRLTPRQLEAVLAHELCHVRRRDNLLASIHMLVEAIFWFHPLVWWIGARLVEERERACDEEVLRLGNEPRDYAEGILNVCKSYLESPLRCVSGVTGSDLKKRIEWIVAGHDVAGLSFAKKTILACASVLVLAAPVLVGGMNTPYARAQPFSRLADIPKFEVASIKRSAPGSRGPTFYNPTRARFAIDGVTAKGLVAYAYDVRDFQVSGGPGWASSEEYDIVGKPSGEATSERILAMARELLAERFNLRLHHESKETSVWALTIARRGPRLQLSVSTDGPEVRGGRGGLVARHVTMGQLAAQLAGRVLDRPVLDRTGIAGEFDVNLQWTPDETQDLGPSIFTALEEQLGLKLEPQKGVVDLLVIDHVERPSEN